MKARLIAVLVAAIQVASAQLPTGASVAAGRISIAQGANSMTITQSSQAAIVNWQSFDIGAGSQVNLVQPNAAAALLARVAGGSPTALQGTLQANGQLFLINPAGIVIGKNAIIDTGAFLASTLDISNSAFVAGGPLSFSGTSAAGVTNLGTITASEGNVYLFAHTVANSGSISAPHGTAGLAAGTQVELASPNAPGFTVGLNLPSTTAKTGVDNSGVIAAAQAQLEAAGGSIYELAVNQSGVVRATGSATVNGRVLLTADGGTVGISGSVSAQNADGSGGEILVGGDRQGGNAAVPNSSYTVVTSTGSLDASAASGAGAGGQVIVWSDEGTRFLGTLAATGSTGGFAEVSGRQYLDFNPASPVQLGAGGNLLLDPDALVISTAANSDTTTTSGNPYLFGSAATGANLNVNTLESQLAATNVTLDTSSSGGDITVNAPITWATNNTLRLNAGGSINLNASITGGPSSTLALYAGLDTNSTIPAEDGGVSLSPAATLDGAASITVGTLVYGANASANVAGQTVITPAGTGILDLEGNVSVNTLEVDLSGGQAGVVTNGSSNSIGAFKAVGSGELYFAYVANNEGPMSVTFDSTVAQGPYLQFFAPGNLTLTSGSSLSFDASSPGTVVLASTGGAFINQAGGSAFGANTNYQIYTSSPAATTLGGLTGTDLYAHPYNSADSYTGNYVFFASSASSTPVLTYSADDLSRTYGASNPVLTYTTTGWLEGVIDDVTGSPSLSVGATQSSGVGAYAISIGQGSLASSNYDFSFVPGTLTIDKAPLTITVNNASKVYGAANPLFSYTASGFVNDDTAAVLSGAPNLSTAATASSGVGSYSVAGTEGALSASNYDFTFVPGTLRITPAELTITGDAASKVYGSANPTLTYTATGFVNGDSSAVLSGSPSLSTTATASSGVGQYPIAVGSGNLSASNYDFTFNSGTLSVTPAELILTPNSASRIYGSANPTFSYTVAGLVNGDTSAAFSGAPSLSTAATAGSGVGSYAITGATGTLSASNYDFAFAPGTLNITRADLTITPNGASKMYGAANPTFSYTAAGFVNGDTAAALSGAPNLSTTASSSSGVGSYAITATTGTLSASNYEFTFVPGTLSITPADLIITPNGASKVYGSANPTLSYTAAGFVNGDTAAVLSGAPSLSTPATSLSGVGNYPITAAAGNLSASNYDFTFDPGTLRITPAPLTVDILSANRLYGQPNPTFDAVISGFQNGDTSSVISGYALSTSATAASSSGDYLITGSGTAANYQITFNPAYLLIQQSPVYITIPNATATSQGVPSSFPAEYTAPASVGPNYTVTGVSTGTSASAPGTYPITAVITGTDGISLAALEDDYVFYTKQAGILTIKPPAVVTTSVSLQPGTLLQNLPTGTLVNDSTTQPNQTVTVNQPQSVTVTTDPNSLTSYVPPLSAAQYANFLGEYAGDFPAVQSQLASTYQSFLKGQGVSGSPYENMPAAARTLLSQWMTGGVSTQYLQSEVSIGDPTALEVLSFIMPGLVQMTLNKPTSALTFDDNTILSRLGTLTAQHMSSVVTIAQYNYQQMLKSNAAQAKSSGLAVLFSGGGDFSNIVQQANQQALGEYLGASLGAAAGGAGVSTVLSVLPAVLYAVFPNVQPALLPATAVAGPAIAVMNLAVLAVRAVQISQSQQNQSAYNALMANWPPGSSINTISQLKGPGMSQNVQIGTAMLAADVLSLAGGS